MKPEEATVMRTSREDLQESLVCIFLYRPDDIILGIVSLSGDLKVNYNQIRWMFIYSFPATVTDSFKGEITRWLLF